MHTVYFMHTHTLSLCSIHRSVVRRALEELFGAGAALGGAFEICSGGRDAELWELAAIVSAPGAAAQIMHADCDGHADGPLLHTAFVALQPVTRSLGPTRFVPRTHSDPVAYEAVCAKGDVTGLVGGVDVAAGADSVLSYVGILSTGDAQMYDGRILHCGGPNTDDDATARAAGATDGLRVQFYTTFRHADREDAEGNPAARSLLTRYSGRVTLGMLRDGRQGGGFDGFFAGDGLSLWEDEP